MLCLDIDVVRQVPVVDEDGQRVPEGDALRLLSVIY